MLTILASEVFLWVFSARFVVYL